ncbi:MAG: hypothetical protein NVSMB36_27160 [Escherichia coli]
MLHRAPGTHARELARYPDPLSPAAAARRSGRPALTRSGCAEAVRGAAQNADLVLVEGAGGLLVRYNDDGFTMADLAAELALPVLVVTAAGLGTLNTTALTLEAMATRSLELSGIVIGAWPAQPDLAARCNIRDLESLAGQPLAGALTEGAGRLAPTAFAAAARAGLAPAFHGDFSADAFRNDAR